MWRAELQQGRRNLAALQQFAAGCLTATSSFLAAMLRNAWLRGRCCGGAAAGAQLRGRPRHSEASCAVPELGLRIRARAHVLGSARPRVKEQRKATLLCWRGCFFIIRDHQLSDLMSCHPFQLLIPACSVDGTMVTLRSSLWRLRTNMSHTRREHHVCPRCICACLCCDVRVVWSVDLVLYSADSNKPGRN